MTYVVLGCVAVILAALAWPRKRGPIESSGEGWRYLRASLIDYERRGEEKPPEYRLARHLR